MNEARSEQRPRLVVTADDAGMCGDWDRAIAAARHAGIVTAVSVVTNGDTYPELRPWLAHPGSPDIGIHLNVIAGRPLCASREVGTLVDDDGRLPGSVRRFLSRYLLSRVDRDDVAREWRRQVARALEDGLRPTHLNSHYHVHLLPGLFDLAVELARQFDIRWVRVADEPPWRPGRAVLRPTSLLRSWGLWIVCRGHRSRLRRAGLGYEVSSWGAGHGGRLGLPEWTDLLGRLGSEPVEIVCHPGQFPEEAAALSSPDLVAALRRRAALRGYRDLMVAP